MNAPYLQYLQTHQNNLSQFKQKILTFIIGRAIFFIKIHPAGYYLTCQACPQINPDIIFKKDLHNLFHVYFDTYILQNILDIFLNPKMLQKSIPLHTDYVLTYHINNNKLHLFKGHYLNLSTVKVKNLYLCAL